MIMLSAIETYLATGRIPWSPGYGKFKNQFINECFANPAIMECFRTGAPLPLGFGPRLDERVVEYPWSISRLRDLPGRIFDAGSVFNCPLALDHPDLRDRSILIYTLLADWITLRPNVSYVFGDLRETIFRDEVFDVIVCISTIEHVGMQQNFKARALPHFRGTPEQQSHHAVIREFHRLLRPGGHLLLTVPYGAYEDHGWLQQFDAPMLDAVARTFGGAQLSETIYRYVTDGWQVSDRGAAAQDGYYNIHADPVIPADGAAAARAVACLHLQKFA
jgi:SAM-dependent methyltransferase